MKILQISKFIISLITNCIDHYHYEYCFLECKNCSQYIAVSSHCEAAKLIWNLPAVHEDHTSAAFPT